MKNILIILLGLCSIAANAQPLRLHPDNPHIFQYKGKALLIIGSGEHYGAVSNLDFNYSLYLQSIQADGLNTTRLFTGGHRENPGDFGITRNTLGPTGDRFICAWARTDQPGFKGGGNKFDLNRWDEAYFARLKDFVSQALARDIIIEINLFSAYYGAMWPNNPMHPTNNINGTPEMEHTTVNTINNGAYWAYQEAYIRKMVRELNGFDNIYFEIQNEPWADKGVVVGEWLDNMQADLLKDAGNQWRTQLEVASPQSLAWQKKVAAVIRDEEQKLPKKHLISQNYVNFKMPLREVDANIDIINFHYAHPEAATWNLHWNKAVGCNETGFSGMKGDPYRKQAWRFMLSGGTLFNNLDYSYTVGNEAGTDTTATAPGHGSPRFRSQLRFLRTFLEGFDLLTLKPQPNLIKWSKGAQPYLLRDTKGQYALYCDGYEPFQLNLNLPAGRYSLEWYDPRTGQLLKKETLTLAPNKPINSPENNYQEIAGKLRYLGK
jgi:hypothetical protein